jgi:hypothetical protein
MEDNDPRVGKERIAGRGDETVAGREGARESWNGAAAPGATRDYANARSEEPDRRTREIRRDIERTREDMAETVDAIQDRLSPRNLASNAVDSVRSAASEKARELGETEPVQYARANPIPTAMVGVGIAGLAWLAFGGRDADRYGSRRSSRSRSDWRSNAGYYEVDDERGRSHTERFAHGGSAADYTPGLGNRSSSESFGRSFGSPSSRYGNPGRLDLTTNQLQRSWNENPLLMGAAAAVLGAIVGMAVPETERENELMGETRDSMIDGVQQTVRDKVDQVQQAASTAVGQVQNAVGLTGETPAADKRPAPGKPGSTDFGRS